MLNKIKKIFTLITWKRWFIIAFSFVCFFLFIGLSFGLKSKDSKVSQDYKNGISLVVKPYENDLPIKDESYSKQLLFNLETRIKNNYPDYFVSSSFEENNVWNIDVTNIVNSEQINSFKSFILNKENLTLTTINAKLNTELYNNTTNNNLIFNSANKSNSNYELYMSSSNAQSFYWWAKYLNDNSNEVIIWKNFDILKQIIKQDSSYTNDQTIYEYLYVNGITPEKYDEASSVHPVLFKEEWTFNGKKYKPTDFIVSKNPLIDFKNNTSITIKKDFGVPTSQSLTSKDIDKEFYDLSYWVSNYTLDNSEFSPFIANNGNNSYIFLLIALISFFAIVSIFVVINYGYLGIFSIFILAMVVFLTLLMIGIFFGNYDSILIASILLSSIIVLDFVVYFFERIKSEFFKGNSIAKSIKNSINKHKLSIFLKSCFLTLGMIVFYGVMSFIFSKFSIIVLISSLAIPIFVVPCILGFSWIFSGLETIGKSPKLIGLWNKKYLHLNYIDKESSLTESMNETMQDKIFIENENIKQIQPNLTSNPIQKYQLAKEKRFLLFKKHFEFKGLVSLLSIISCILIIGLILFLVGFFNKGKSLTGSFNISAQDQQQTILRIQKKQNTETLNDKFTNEEIDIIKKTLVTNFGFDDSKIRVKENSLIEIHTNKEFSSEKINEAILKINSLYDLVIIPSNLISSDTFKVMQYTLYSALLAILAMSIFVLIWMKPAKAFIFILVSLISIILFVFMVAFGFIVVNPMLSVAATFAFVLLSLSTINVLYNIHYKIKTIRTEEMSSEEIKEVVYKQTFKILKPFVITNSITFFMFLLFTILIGSLPTMFTLFMMLFVIVSSILVIVLVPKLACIFEVLKSRIRRKIILENYWDTEKIKEQTFNGINNIK